MFGITPTDFVGTKWAGHILMQVVAGRSYSRAWDFGGGVDL